MSSFNDRVVFTTEFYSNCATYIEPQTVEQGKIPYIPKTPVKVGYTFLGWFLDGKKFDFSTPPDKDLTLVAHWDKNDKSFYPSDTRVVKFDGINAGLHIVWKDNADALGLRPQEVICLLSETCNDQQKVYEIILSKNTVIWKDPENAPKGCSLTQGAGGAWTLSLKGLPEKKGALNCSYSLVQKPLDGKYTTQISGTAVTNTISGYVPSVDKTVKLTTRNSRLYDAAGNLIVFKGVVTYNVGLPSLDESVTPASLAKLASIGCNAIRVSMQLIGVKGTCSGYVWYAKKDGGRTGDYNDDNAERASAEDKQKMIAKIDEIIAMATEAGLYVIIDWALFTSNPYQYVNEASEFFGILAEHHANNPYVLFEICNEPAKCTWGGDSAIKAYAERIIDVIRGKGSDAVIVLSPRGSAYYVAQRSVGPTPGDDPIDDPLDDERRRNVAYTFHNYPYVNPYSKFSWKLREAYESGLTIVCTEMSPMDAAFDTRDPIGYDMKQMALFTRMFQEWDINFFLFRYGHSSLYNEWLMLTQGIAPQQGEWTRDDLTECGKWYYDLVTGDGVFITDVDYDSPRIPLEKKKFENTHTAYGIGNPFPTFALTGEMTDTECYFKVSDTDSLTDKQYEAYCDIITKRAAKASAESNVPLDHDKLVAPKTKDIPLELTYTYDGKIYTLKISYVFNKADQSYGILFGIK